jgi:hypothetical protein
MNPDIDAIMGCGSKQDLGACVADSQCKWYKGKTVAANNDLPATGGKLFETNFCHPANWDGIEKSLPYCIKETNKDSCAQKGCVWSVGKELAPDSGFCQVDFVTEANADLLLSCPKNPETACPAPCKWYPGKSAPPVTGSDCTPPSEMPPPSCEQPASPTAAAAEVPSAWSPSECTFKCPTGSNYKPKPMFTYPFCHPHVADAADKAKW